MPLVQGAGDYSGVKRDAQKGLRNAGRSMLLLFATIFLVVGGVIAATFAGFYAMEPAVGTSVAGLIVAAVYLTVALILNVITSMRHHRGI